MPHVLIIDDSMFQRFTLVKSLKALGFTTQEAASGAQGLDILANSRPDAVLLDLNMPGMTGLETLVAIRNSLKELPVAIITADIQPSTRSRCEEAGANAMLNKPAGQEQIAALMRTLIPDA